MASNASATFNYNAVAKDKIIASVLRNVREGLVAIDAAAFPQTFDISEEQYKGLIFKILRVGRGKDATSPMIAAKKLKKAEEQYFLLKQAVETGAPLPTRKYTKNPDHQRRPRAPRAPAPEHLRCQGTKANGSQCTAHKKVGDYCQHHDGNRGQRMDFDGSE